MGANVSDTVSKLSIAIDNQLEQVSNAQASATCDITVGNIRIGESTPECNINFQNRCGASASAYIDGVADAVANAWQNSTTDQKTDFAALGLNVNATDQEIKQEVTNYLTQQCVANADLRQRIATGGIDIGTCRGSITQINTGNAVGDCAVNAVLSTAATAQQESETQQETTGLFQGLRDLVNNPGSVIASIIICIILIVGIIIFVWYKFGSSGSSSTSYGTPGYGTPGYGSSYGTGYGSSGVGRSGFRNPFSSSGKPTATL